MHDVRLPSAVMVIAEAGVNHNGQPDMAFALVEAAARAGADAVKFQSFQAASLVTPGAPKAAYQQRATGADESQLDMLRRLELPVALYHELKSEAQRHGLRFMSTAFDDASLRLLVDELGLSLLKIPSGELTNAPLLLQHARTGAELIVSTGMASLFEVELALGVIAFGRIAGTRERPGLAAFRAAYASPEGQAALRQGVALLHCTSDYPAAAESVNLRAMNTLGAAFGLPVGYSDHTLGIAIALAAVARGACVIEKHLSLDRTLPGPDHAASLEPHEFAALVSGVRAVSASLGDGIKRPQAAEMATAAVACKSLVTRTAVRAGERLHPGNVAVMRPGTGMSPMRYWDVIGRVASRDYAAGELLDE